MNERIRETLIDVFCRVLEQVAFAFGEETPKEELPSGEFSSHLHCSISFRGPFNGTIEIALPSEFCEELAANTLGAEQEEVTPEMAADALKEIANVTCGQWLTAVAGEKPVFDLTVPTIEQLDSAGWGQLRDKASSIAMIVDDVPALITVSVEGDIPSD